MTEEYFEDLTKMQFVDVLNKILSKKATNEVINNSNKKENDTMMNNKMTKKEERMEALNNAGVNTNNFFNLNMSIPVGANVVVTIDGVPYTINSCNDAIIKQIMDEGYVYNAKTSGRWVCAQTFKMLNGKSYNWKTRQYEYGFDAYLRNNYPFMYEFQMMADELHRLSKMENNDPEFELLKNFFSKTVIVETCKHYIRQLKKFIKNQPRRKCKGVPYVKLNKYGDVFVKDLDAKVYNKLDKALTDICNAHNYKELEFTLRKFIEIMPKLPAETPKCSEWKDAFKGKGGFMTLMNLCKHHGVTLQNYETGEILNRDESVKYIESLIETYKGEYWKYHELLKKAIADNNFDLRKSIESQK